MALVRCPECGAEVSDAAPQCPKCGRPLLAKAAAPATTKLNIQGSVCPACGNRYSSKHTEAGCFYWTMVALFVALPLILYPFLPRVWRCHQCGQEWRA